MLCSEIKDKLYEYIYEELGLEENNKIEEHLKECKQCQSEFEELRKLLVYDMKKVTFDRDAIVIPQDLSSKIKNEIKRKKPIKFSQYAAAACVLFFIFYAVPVVAYYTVENTFLKKYIDFDNSLVKDIDEGRLELVNRESTLKDINFRIDGIIRKPEETTILFTVKVPKGKNVNYAMPRGHNVVMIQDQFGFKYKVTSSAMTLKSANEDGEVTAIINIEPLKFWSYRLFVNITAMETGTMSVVKVQDNEPRADENNLIYDMKESKTQYGSWKVDFYIDRGGEQ